jgi:alkanesulfonate monooxygenase SsuD/methylene tetrahydromethanopterin reductase-like flavin-dependent oxidoreductase (luciferase family)
MDFGVFDHLDRGKVEIHEHYEERLQLIEAYDDAGFHGYHVAEHHFTPLGMAPSPSVFLAAIAQRTKRLRFGPLVYALPLHNPLRLLEEICMVDQMSRGRLEIGFGRGSSPVEGAYYGRDPKEAQSIYAEYLEVILEGLTKPSLDFQGQFSRFDKVPMELRPFQKPHPPVWYGMHSVDSAERAARKGFNVVANGMAGPTRAATDRFRKVWADVHRDTPLPKIGLVRFLVVGHTDDEAQALARRAYPHWYKSFNHLYRLHGRSPVLGERAPDFERLCLEGKGVAGSPSTVAEFVRAQMEEAGANYFVGQFAFGDLSLDEVLESLRLFVNEVMPALRDSDEAAGCEPAAGERACASSPIPQ